MDDRDVRLRRLREAEARLAAAAGAEEDDELARRLDRIRHDIELALSDIEDTIARTRAAQARPPGGE